MTSTYKPFRLINSRELQQIEQNFQSYLQVWNDQYALLPLTLTLSTTTKSLSDDSYHIAHHHQQPILLWSDSPNQLIQNSLFGEVADCFATISHAYFKLLLEQLLNSQTLSYQSVNNQDRSLEKDWFYKGSPTITMHLSSQDESIDLYLHPQYVLRLLPSCLSNKPKSLLPDALTTQTLDCHIEFNPLSLRLHDLQHLRIGDVIKTDHLLSQPLRLVHQQQLISHVEPGASKSLKSIQIKSLL